MSTERVPRPGTKRAEVIALLKEGNTREAVAAQAGTTLSRIKAMVYNSRQTGYLTEDELPKNEWQVGLHESGTWNSIGEYALLRMYPGEIKYAAFIEKKIDLPIGKIKNSLAKARHHRKDFIQKTTPEEIKSARSDSLKGEEGIIQRVPSWLEVRDTLKAAKEDYFSLSRIDWRFLIDYLDALKMSKAENRNNSLAEMEKKFMSMSGKRRAILPKYIAIIHYVFK